MKFLSYLFYILLNKRLEKHKDKKDNIGKFCALKSRWRNQAGQSIRMRFSRCSKCSKKRHLQQLSINLHHQICIQIWTRTKLATLNGSIWDTEEKKRRKNLTYFHFSAINAHKCIYIYTYVCVYAYWSESHSELVMIVHKLNLKIEMNDEVYN